MLFGTRNVSCVSVVSTRSTAENQRLKVSALTCGLRAAASRCQSSAHLSFIGVINSVTQPSQSDFPRENERRRARVFAFPVVLCQVDSVAAKRKNFRNTREQSLLPRSIRAWFARDRHLG